MATNQKALQRRGNQNTAVATRPVDTAVEAAGSSTNPAEITASLEAANQTMHLISPATKCGSVPDGCAVMMSRVLIDSNDDGQVYPISGSKKLGLGKVPLKKISLAVGISWDPVLSRRDDDGSDPAFCQYTAVGYLHDFDGSEKTIIGTKAIDLRRGSALWQDAHERARTKAIDEAKNGVRGKLATDKERAALEKAYAAAEKELRHARIHILSNAQTKAELRAIRSIGLKSSYTVDELQKPFVAAKLIFTGESTDPQNREIYARARAEKFLGARHSAYGTPALPPAKLSPPPIMNELDDDDYTVGAHVIDADENGNGNGHTSEPPQTGRQPQQTTLPTENADSEQGAAGDDTGEQQSESSERERPPDFEIKFGKDKGKMVSQVDDAGLSWLVTVYDASIENPEKAQWKDKNQRERAIILQWVDYWQAEEN